MEEQLKKLYELQRLTLRINRIDEVLAGIPEKIEKTSEELTASEEKSSMLAEQLEQTEKDQRQVTGEMDIIQKKISDYRSQLNDSKQITSNTQYRAMLKQIDTAEEETYQLLERQYAAEELMKKIRQDQKQQVDDHEEISRNCLKKKQELEEQMATHLEARASLAAQRDELEGTVDPELMAVFSRVASVRGGMGLAPVHGDVCSVCHVRLRPQMLCEVKLNSEVIQCESCRRIFFWTVKPAPKEAVEEAG